MLRTDQNMSPDSQAPRPQSLGMLLGVAPATPSHRYAVRLALTAQKKGIQVYLYLLDDATEGVLQPEITQLIDRGVKISACAYAMQRRHLEFNESITFGGLGLLNDIINHTDRFVGFCH